MNKLSNFINFGNRKMQYFFEKKVKKMKKALDKDN